MSALDGSSGVRGRLLVGRATDIGARGRRNRESGRVCGASAVSSDARTRVVAVPCTHGDARRAEVSARAASREARGRVGSATRRSFVTHGLMRAVVAQSRRGWSTLERSGALRSAPGPRFCPGSPGAFFALTPWIDKCCQQFGRAHGDWHARCTYSEGRVTKSPCAAYTTRDPTRPSSLSRQSDPARPSACSVGQAS